MSLLNRKPRPIAREELKERDDRIFFVATDDTYAPKQYFDGLELPRVKVKVLPCEDRMSAATHVINGSVAFKNKIQADHEVLADDEFWVMLDVDHNLTGTHKSGFVLALDTARKNGFSIAVSNPCFEVWLLFHHLECKKGQPLEGYEKVREHLMEVIGGYDKTNVKRANFTSDQIELAIKHARSLEDSPDNPPGYWPENPGSRVYRLFENIFRR